MRTQGLLWVSGEASVRNRGEGSFHTVAAGAAFLGTLAGRLWDINYCLVPSGAQLCLGDGAQPRSFPCLLSWQILPVPPPPQAQPSHTRPGSPEARSCLSLRSTNGSALPPLSSWAELRSLWPGLWTLGFFQAPEMNLPGPTGSLSSMTVYVINGGRLARGSNSPEPFQTFSLQEKGREKP